MSINTVHPFKASRLKYLSPVTDHLVSIMKVLYITGHSNRQIKEPILKHSLAQLLDHDEDLSVFHWPSARHCHCIERALLQALPNPAK